jgi:serine/threonine-protein kinase
MTISGRYRIDRLLGEGGMGAVYEAEHTHMRKRLAVKVLHAEMSRLPEVVARFEREAMAAAHIDHPNVASATDFGKLDDGSFFLVLEYVEGHSLREAIAVGRIELGRALHIAFQIAAALQRAHALGIVHRDLKPENVMLVERDADPDFVKVLDFGIAKVPVGELASAPPAASQASGAPQVLTQMGMVYGTPEYMAPEQALGQAVDPRADLYGLGVMLYEMLAGSRPFDAESKVSLLGMHVTARVPPFSERAPEALVPPEVEAIVMRLMAKEANDRYADAKELMDALLAATAVLVERGRIDPHIAHTPLMGAPSASSPNLGSLLGPMSMRGPMGSAMQVPGTIRSPQASAPTRIASESGRIATQSESLMKNPRTPVIVAAVLGALSVIVLGAVVIAGRADKPAGPVEAVDGAATASASVPEKPPGEPGDDDKIKSGLASIDKGDYGSGIATLTTLEPRNMDRPEVHRALVKGYLATGNTKDAMKEAGLLVNADPTAATDPKLLEDVRNAALGKGEGADTAFGLLEGGFGPKGAGIDVLYEMAFAQWSSEYPAAAARAQKALAKSDVKGRATSELRVALDLRNAQTCAKKKDLLQRATDVGDYRALPLLKAYAARKGCGFLGSRDCWPCMHKDGTLDGAIKAIEDRTSKH